MVGREDVTGTAFGTTTELAKTESTSVACVLPPGMTQGLETSYSVGAGTFRALAELVQLFADTLDDPWPLEAMAAKSGYDVFHFAHAFREVMGVAPAQYLRLLRLERAAHDLFHEEKALARVAEKEASYASVEAFRRAFTRAFARSPLEVRKAGLGWNAARAVAGSDIPDVNTFASRPPEILDGPVLEEVGPLRGIAIRAGKSSGGLAEPYFQLVGRSGDVAPWTRGVATPPQGVGFGSGARPRCRPDAPRRRGRHARGFRASHSCRRAADLAPPFEPWRMPKTWFARDFTLDAGQRAHHAGDRLALSRLAPREWPPPKLRAPSLTFFDESDWARRSQSLDPRTSVRTGHDAAFRAR